MKKDIQCPNCDVTLLSLDIAYNCVNECECPECRRGFEVAIDLDEETDEETIDVRRITT